MKNISIVIILIVIINYSLKADNWIEKADFIGNSRSYAIGFSINGKGYFGTGAAFNEGFSKSFWEYEPDSDIWTQLADLDGAGREYAAGFSIGGKGYMGTGHIDGYNQATNDFWEYDPQANTWKQRANFGGGKRFAAFSFSIGNKGYIGGGDDFSALYNDLWEYDPVADVWTEKSSFGGFERMGASAFVINDKAYVGTGRNYSEGYANDFWEYDYVINLWTQKSNFPGDANQNGVGFSVNGKGYMGLGKAYNPDTYYYHDLWQYNTVLDSWNQKTSYPGGAGSGASVFVINDKAYIGTGGSPGTSGKDFWEYTSDSINTSVEDQLLNQIQLSVYPNPVINSSYISFYLTQNSLLTLELFESTGTKVKTLFSKNLKSGKHKVQLNRGQFSAGIYFLKMKINDQVITTKIVIE
jgi:N-acetylneuraminic acid mutarotase